MPIKTIPSNDIIVRLDHARTAIVMTDTAPERSDGPRAGDHIVGAGGIAEIRHIEETSFGEMRTAGVIQFETPAQLAKALAPFGAKPGHEWIGEGPRSGSADISGKGDVSLAGRAFAAIAASEGAHVLYDGGLSALARTQAPKVQAWLYEHDGMVHDRNHPASLTVNRREGVSEPWNERAVEIDPTHRPKRGDLMEVRPTPGSEALWARADEATLKALKEADNRTIPIIASRQDLRDAISVLKETEGSVTPTGRVLAALAPAIAQPQWARGEYGKLKETGEVKTGLDALETLSAGFGKGEHRKVMLNAGKAEALLGGMDAIVNSTYEQVLETSAERDRAFQAARAAAPPKKAAGASR